MGGLSVRSVIVIIIYIFTPLWVIAVRNSWWHNVRLQLTYFTPKLPLIISKWALYDINYGLVNNNNNIYRIPYRPLWSDSVRWMYPPLWVCPTLEYRNACWSWNYIQFICCTCVFSCCYVLWYSVNCPLLCNPTSIRQRFWILVTLLIVRCCATLLLYASFSEFWLLY